MNSGTLLLDRPQETLVSFRDERGTYQGLVQRVASSNTFEKSPRLRAAAFLKGIRGEDWRVVN